MTDDELRELDRLLVKFVELPHRHRDAPLRRLHAIGVLRKSISVLLGRRKRRA